jgi:ElaB/YqjD/DUF883 family membrane-anchored ribosome-binding protein
MGHALFLGRYPAMNEPLADAILEIPVSELQHFFNDLISTFNSLNDLLRDNAILRGKELAELNTRANQAVKAAQSPIEKLLVLNAYIRQQIGHVGRALQARPPASPTDQGVIRQAITKVALRAQAIVEHVKIIAEGKKEVAFNSSQTRDFLAGREGKPPSRRDVIRSLRRAEKICPALACKPTPGDGRQTMRLTARAEDLKDSGSVEESLHSANRRRSRMEEVRMIFFKEGIF